jgi:Reverse transcriptase (RNA-dependent DNA polymerase)
VSAVVASPAAKGSAGLDPVRALQHALYRAAKADPGRRFHALYDKVRRRDVLWRAWAAVRSNNGAPGIDKVTLAAVEEYGVARLLDELASELGEGRYRPLPARRVMIPKPGTTEQRPLSIPPVRDRIVQAAAKIVLEPVFEADFLPVSFGFRPKRSAHDALQVLMEECGRGRRWVAETDIASCFSAIPQEKLMQAVQERVCDQAVLKLLRVMLRAGVMEDGQVRRAVTGTPQGGVLTPPTQWATSASRSRSATGGWSGHGAPLAISDIPGSTVMSCRCEGAQPAVSTLSGSTRPPRWRRRVSRRPRPRGSWRDGSAVRCGRPAGMWTRRQHRAGCRFPSRAWCSPSSCRGGWWLRSESTPGLRGGRSRRWWPRRWRSSWRGLAGSVQAGEREGGRGGVRVRPARGGGPVGGLRHLGASTAGPHWAGRPGRKITP